MRWITCILTLAALTGPAQADLIGRFLESPGTCYAVVYDAEALAERPRQQVTGLFISNTAPQKPGRSEFLLDFAYTTRDGSRYEAKAACLDDQCRLAGNGGSFAVSETGDGLRFDFAAHSILNQRMGAGELSGSDDLVFLVFPDEHAVCR